MHIIRFWRGARLLALTMAMLPGVLWAQSGSGPDSADFYYYKGKRKVPVALDTGRLALETTRSVSSMASALLALPRDITFVPADSATKTMLGVKATSKDQLNAAAGQIRRGIPQVQVQAVLRHPARPQDVIVLEQISFRLTSGVSVTTVSDRYKLSRITPVSYSPNTYTATVSSTGDLLAPVFTANRMQESGDAVWASPLLEEQQHPRVLDDPLLINQWHLQNTGTNTSLGVAGNDLNIFPAWSQAMGTDVVISINDSGVETAHPDLVANLRMDLSFDFNDQDNDPNPLPTQAQTNRVHGTSVAGLAAGRGNNGIGISGTAPHAEIAALRTIAMAATDAVLASSLVWKASETSPSSQVSVSTNSWGPTDNGSTLEGPGPLTEAAIEYGVLNGRNGKGIIYIWAAGNGRQASDNINKDGYGNNPRVIAVGATNSNGTVAYYSERGSAVLVNAPGGETDGLVTTDLSGIEGFTGGDYRSNFIGTSAAAPLVSGVVALLLQVRPDLSWRDVMHILVETATRNHPASNLWELNGAGRYFHHDYGFGRVNATAAVTAAQSWINVPESSTPIAVEDILTSPVSIPDNTTSGVLINIPVSASTQFRIEHVEVECDITHLFRGDLTILLQSPSGMVSELLPSSYDSGDNFSNWRLRSVAHWGENPAGNWRILLADVYPNYTGTINALSLRIFGFETPSANVDNWGLY